jgi:dUTP pyrophosphatase
MKVNIKKLDEKAVIPKYAKNGDAGLDLVAISRKETDNYIEYGTGLAIEIPDGFVGLLFPRSSISKMGLSLANSVGVVDSGYRGGIKLRFKNTFIERPDGLKKQDNIYQLGDKVAQLIILPYPKIELIEVDELSDTDRGKGGFGSTGE